MDATPRTALSPETIVDAAEQLINDTGTAEWTMRSLSRILSCAPGALYRHFPGGAGEIAAEIRTRDFARLAAYMGAAEEDADAPGLGCLDSRSSAARLIRRCRAYLDFVEANPSVYQHLFGPLGGEVPPQPDETVERAMIERPAELIRAAAQARELNRPVIGHCEATQVAALLWIQLHGFAHLRLSGIVAGRLDDLEVRLLVNLLALAGFTVAATPAGLEAAAKAAATPIIHASPARKAAARAANDASPASKAANDAR
ncbi:MAG: TetR/AcrR family transcriptional regulator [Alphaproteobacteria bacterium]